MYFAVARDKRRAYKLFIKSDLDPVYFNHPGVALVTWNPDLRAVCLEPQAWADTGEAQAVLDATIRALRHHHGSRWLLDGRQMKAIKRADQDWTTKNWLPRAAAAGLKLAAIVQPTSLATKVCEDGVDVRFFATVEMAAEWLTSPSAMD